VHCTADEVEEEAEASTEESAAEDNCDSALVGDDWWLVRRTTGRTHPATDQLVGTEVYGKYGVNTFSVDFEDTVPGYNQFLFTTGTCNHWMIMTKDSVTGAWYNNELREVLSSHVNHFPYEAYAYRREANPEDPWLQYGTDHDEATALYAENNYNANSAGDSEGSLYDGLNVYVRVETETETDDSSNSTSTDADPSEFAVCAGHAPDNGLCNYTCISQELDDYEEFFFPFDTTGATVESGEVGEGSISNTVWYEFYNSADRDLATVSLELVEASDDDVVFAIYEGTKKVKKVCADINAPRFDYLKLIGEGAVLSDVPLKTKKHYYIQVDGAETCGLLKATTTRNEVSSSE